MTHTTPTFTFVESGSSQLPTDEEDDGTGFPLPLADILIFGFVVVLYGWLRSASNSKSLTLALHGRVPSKKNSCQATCRAKEEWDRLDDVHYTTKVKAARN